MELTRHVLTASMLDADGDEVTAQIEVRYDPLTGHSSPSASASGEKVISFDVDHRSSQRVSDI